MGSLMCPLCCGRGFSSREFLKNHLLCVLENLHCADCNQKFDNIRELASHLDESCTEQLRIADDAPSEASVNVNADVPVCGEDPETTKMLVENLDYELGINSNVDIPGVSHFCSTCNMHVTSVMEHITLRHPNETVYYYEPGTEEEEDEVEGSNMSESVDPSVITAMSESNESNQLLEELTLKQTSDKCCEEMATPRTRSEATDTNYSTPVPERWNNLAPDGSASTFPIRSECRAFRTRLTYKDHMLCHMDARSFPCKICPKSFKTSSSLGHHSRIHSKQFTCVTCGRKFATLQHLNHHSKLHTLATVLKHKCHICGAMYGRAYMLKNHIEAHDTSALATSEEVNESDSEAVRTILST